MIKGTSEELTEITKTHDCPEHGHKLGVAWDATANSHVIRCAEDHFPEEVISQLTPTKEFRQGKREPVGKGLNLLPTVDLATGEVITPILREALIAYAKQYGMDAYRGHVMLMYGKPYIGIDGYLYHANQQKIPYQLRSRPLEDGERRSLQLNEGDHGWKSEIIKPGDNEYFCGFGIVTQEEMTATSKKDKTQLRSPVVAAHPWQLAQKRAEWQALRRAFPIGETEDKEVTK